MSDLTIDEKKDLLRGATGSDFKTPLQGIDPVNTDLKTNGITDNTKRATFSRDNNASFTRDNNASFKRDTKITAPRGLEVEPFGASSKSESRTKKPHAFSLGRGSDGATIYFGQLLSSVTIVRFERLEMLDGQMVNSLTGQDEIPGITQTDPENLDTGHGRLRATKLDWWGDVYLYWEADPESGEITLCDVRGPDAPEGIPIRELDIELSRDGDSSGGVAESIGGVAESSDGVEESSGSGAENGGSGAANSYYVLLGNVPEDGQIEQHVSSDVTWAVTLIPEEMESSSSESSSSSSESSSSSSSPSSSASSNASSESGSDKSSAIVPASWSKYGYTALLTLEAPDVRFEDVFQDLSVSGRETRHRIDFRFLSVIEPDTLRVVGLVGNRPYSVGAEIDGEHLVIHALTDKRRRPTLVNAKVSAIRKGFKGMRFPLRDREQFLANERHLNSAYPAKDLKE